VHLPLVGGWGPEVRRHASCLQLKILSKGFIYVLIGVVWAYRLVEQFSRARGRTPHLLELDDKRSATIMNYVHTCSLVH
jgi:hypothetical protein